MVACFLPGSYFSNRPLVHNCVGENSALFIFEHLLFICELKGKYRFGFVLALDPRIGGAYGARNDIYGVECHG